MKQVFFTLLLIITISINFAMGQCYPVQQNNPPPVLSTCYNHPITIELDSATGGDYRNKYRWQQSRNGINGWESAYGTNNRPDYTTRNLTSNMYYRRRVTSGCNSGDIIFSDSVLVTVYSQMQITSQSVQQTICKNTSPSTLSVTAEGGDGTYTYQWEKSDDGRTWTNVVGGSGPNTPDYTPARLSATTYFHCVVTSGSNCGTVTSGPIAINIYPDFNPGSINDGSQSVCFNTPTSVITSIEGASGGNGNISYEWRREGFGINYSDSPTFMPTQSGLYTRWAKDGECSTIFRQSSGEWSLTIRDEFNSGSIISGNDTLCLNDSPGQITTINNASGGNMAITYRWKVNGEVIRNSNNANYTPPTPPTSGIYNYVREAKDNICTNGNFLPSVGSYTLVVLPEFRPGSIATQGQTICYNTSAETINSIENASGGSGNVEYQWRKDGVPISNTNFAIYTPSSDGEYTRWVRDIKCTSGFIQSSGAWRLSVRDEFNPGSILADGERICVNSQPVEVGSLTGASGGNEVITYRWKVNDEVINNSNSAFYTPPVQTTSGIYFYAREAKDGICNNWTRSSGNWALVVDRLPEIPQLPSGDNFICRFTEKTEYEVPSVANNYYWELTPAEAGIIHGNGNIVPVFWNTDFIGAAALKVKAENACGESQYSPSLTIEIKESPEVRFLQFSNPVCNNMTDLIYSVTPLDNVIYQWQIERGEIVSGVNENSVVVNWNRNEDGENGKLIINVTDTDGCSYESEFVISMIPGRAPDLNEIVHKTDKNGIPYMLIYPNPTREYLYQWYRNGIPVTGANKQFFYPPDFDITLERDTEYRVYVAGIHDSICGSFTNAYVYRGTQQRKIEIFPNPGNGNFTISFNEFLPDYEGKTIELNIYSITGSLIFRSELDKSGEYFHNPGLNPGIYLIQVTADKEQIFTEKLIVE